MNIQPIIPQLKQNIENKKDNVNFTGAFDAVTMGLRFLQTRRGAQMPLTWLQWLSPVQLLILSTEDLLQVWKPEEEKLQVQLTILL